MDMINAGDSSVIHWMLPEEVVRISLRDLNKKNKVICVPGIRNKALYMAAKLIPERWWYGLDPYIIRRMP